MGIEQFDIQFLGKSCKFNLNFNIDSKHFSSCSFQDHNLDPLVMGFMHAFSSSFIPFEEVHEEVGVRVCLFA